MEDWMRQKTPEEIRRDMIEGAKAFGASAEHAELFVSHVTGERPLSDQEMVRMILDAPLRRAGLIDPRQSVMLESGYGLDAIGAMKGVDLPRNGVETDAAYRDRLIAKMWEGCSGS